MQAYAKLNLALEVIGRREDGYHRIVSVMQLISLADTLVFRPHDSIDVETSDPTLAGPENLVFKAASLLHGAIQASLGSLIVLEKQIPASAGLGGGSSDAAATLVGLDALWGTGLRCRELSSLAEALGSDVPFFLYGGTALVEGRGERVTRLRDPEPVWYALLKPPRGARTRAVFAELKPEEWSDGESTRTVARALCERGRASVGINSLQEPLFRLYPEARECFEALTEVAPGRTFVTGSGPTVAAMFDTRTAAEEALAAIGRKDYWSSVCRSIGSNECQSPCA